MHMGLGAKKVMKDHEAEDKTIEINAQMQGSLSFKDPVSLKINGHFEGSLDVRGTLTIGNTAQVEADINGDNIVVAGKVIGNINANKMLVLMPTAVLKGNIATPKLNIVEGAIFQGNCHMLEDILTTEDVAKYLEIDFTEIISMATSGRIPATKTGEDWRFERAKIDQWASTGKIE